MNMRARSVILRDLADKGLDTSVAYTAGKNGSYVQKKKSEVKTAKADVSKIETTNSEKEELVVSQEIEAINVVKEETSLTEKSIKKKSPPPKKKKSEEPSPTAPIDE